MYARLWKYDKKMKKKCAVWFVLAIMLIESLILSTPFESNRHKVKGLKQKTKERQISLANVLKWRDYSNILTHGVVAQQKQTALLFFQTIVVNALSFHNKLHLFI